MLIYNKAIQRVSEDLADTITRNWVMNPVQVDLLIRRTGQTLDVVYETEGSYDRLYSRVRSILNDQHRLLDYAETQRSAQ